MEYNGKFGHNIERVHHIALMSIIGICYTTFHLETQNLAPTLPGLQGTKHCIQYLASHWHKPIFYPYNCCDGSNVIRLIWSGNQVQDYTTQICLECHQDSDHSRILTKDGRIQVLFILFLVLMSDVKYKFNQLCPLTPLVYKLDACTIMSKKLRLS